MNYRVPESMKPELDEYVAKKLAKYAKKAAKKQKTRVLPSNSVLVAALPLTFRLAVRAGIL